MIPDEKKGLGAGGVGGLEKSVGETSASGALVDKYLGDSFESDGCGGEGAHHVAWVHELVRAAVRIGHGLRLEGRG